MGKNYAEYRYRLNGDWLRVIIAGDVLALPDVGWSMGGFGAECSVEWLFYDGRLPGSRARKQALAEMLSAALATHHGRPGLPADLDGGPMVPCGSCGGSGWVPLAARSSRPGGVITEDEGSAPGGTL